MSERIPAAEETIAAWAKRTAASLVGSGTPGDVRRFVVPEGDVPDAEVYEEPPHRSSGWSMEVGVLKRALRYVPDSYEVMLENAEVDDCEIAQIHIERMYPPDAEGPGLLVLAQGQVVTSEYGYHERMDEDHELGTSMYWNDRKGRWQSR